MEFTGERYIPDQVEGEIVVEHMQRYRSITNLIKDRVVLDAACGEGYGSNLLSEHAKQVYGIDIDQDAIGWAQQKYKSQNLNYIHASIEKLPIEDHSIDVIVSFETIEHVEEKIQINFLREIKRTLKDDGILIISTPDKKNYSDKPNYQNPFHVKEFYEEEFRTFLNKSFKNVYLYSQAFEIFSIISSLESKQSSFPLVNQNNVKLDGKYIIAICSNKDIHESISSLMYQEGINYDLITKNLTDLTKYIEGLHQHIEEQRITIEQKDNLINSITSTTWYKTLNKYYQMRDSLFPHR